MGWTNTERCFGLKIGSLRDDDNPEAVALKKIVETFPWMTDIADHGFDRELSELYMIAVYNSIAIEKRKKEISKEREKKR